MEWSSAKDRSYIARHLLNPNAWNSSVTLSRHVVQNLSAGLGLEIENYDVNNSKPIEDGISARNLYLTRTITDTALSYVECLYYDDADEFENLSRYSRQMVIDGQTYPYSDRLVQLSDSLFNGVISFVANYN